MSSCPRCFLDLCKTGCGSASQISAGPPWSWRRSFAHRYFIDPIDQSMRNRGEAGGRCDRVWMLCQIFRDRSFGMPPIWAVSAGFCGADVCRRRNISRGYIPGPMMPCRPSTPVCCVVLRSFFMFTGTIAKRPGGAMILAAAILPLALFAMVAKIYHRWFSGFGISGLQAATE